MNKLLVYTFIGFIFLSACNTSNPLLPSENALTEIANPNSLTATEFPLTPNFEPTATLSLPVSKLTPVPPSSTKITAENAKDLQEIARYYSDRVDFIAKLTSENEFLFIADASGVDKYDYPSMSKLTHIEIGISQSSASDFRLRPESYFQNTNDGNWVLINNRWLVDLREDNQPVFRDLLAEFPLKNLYIRTVTLAPNGSLLIISDRRCSDTCRWDIAKIISLSDESIKDAPSLYGFSPTISPDGRYVAFSDQVSVNVWSIPDFEKVSTLKIDLPYSVWNIAFSQDGQLVAISQRSNIKVYDVQTGEVEVSIQDLCDNFRRRVMFAPTLPPRVLANSECDSGMWLIDIGRAIPIQSPSHLDFSKIEFNEGTSVSSISYPHPTSALSPYRRQYYFQFLENDALALKNFDQHTVERHSCTLSLSMGSINCTTNSRVSGDGQLTGTDQILGTDGQYYNYTITSSNVEIRSQSDGEKTYYSLPWKGYNFSIQALDPVNKLIFYQVALNVNINKEIIQDMETNRVLRQEEGETYFAPIVFSENKNYAAICQKMGYSGRPFLDKLMIFDLTKKAVVYSTSFTCNPRGGSLSFSSDGSKLAAEYVNSFSGDTAYVRVLLLDIENGFKSQQFDVEASRVLATAFTLDANVLTVMCEDNTICFMDSSNGQEIHRLKAHAGITHIAFSKDGTIMATSSDWGLISLWAVPPLANE